MDELRTRLNKVITDEYRQSIRTGINRQQWWELSCNRHKYSDSKLEEAVNDLKGKI